MSSSSTTSTTINDLAHVLFLMYDLHRRLSTMGSESTFLTVSQIEETAQRLDLPLVYDANTLESILNQGGQQGAILR